MVYIHYHKIELHTKFILSLEISGNDCTMPSQITRLKSNPPDYEDKTPTFPAILYYCNTQYSTLLFSELNEYLEASLEVSS